MYSFTESVENASAQSESRPQMLHIVGTVKEIVMTKYAKTDNGEKE